MNWSMPSTWIDSDRLSFENGDYGWICVGCGSLLPPSERHLRTHIRWHGIMNAHIEQEIIDRFSEDTDGDDG